MLPKSDLLQIFEESQSVYQAPVRGHGLRHDRFQEWVSRHPTERLRALADGIYRSSRYVSHAEFFARYNLIADEILYLVSKFRGKVYLYLGLRQIRKSNFWVLLYLLSRIERVVDAVLTPGDPIEEDGLVIIPDDALYSGKQMVSQLSRLRTSYSGQVLVASGFVSRQAKERISREVENVSFPESCDIFSEYPLPQDVYVYNQQPGELHTIYFDHKLADMYSVYQTIYALGVGLSDEEAMFPYVPVSLIDNCDPPELIHEFVEENYGSGYSLEETVEYFLNELFNGVDIQDVIEICPFSPYKRKKYFLRGEEIYFI